MKKNYVRPMMVGERFAANEYVAACGDKGTVYKFQCNAPEGDLYYYPQSDGMIDGNYQGTGKSIRLGGFHPNSEVQHNASSTEEFYDGYITTNGYSKTNVIVWLEYDYRHRLEDYHATTNLIMKNWETSKS